MDIPDPYAWMPWVKKFLPITGAAEKNALFGADVHDFRRTSMTRRVLEKLCTKKFALIFWPLVEFLKSLGSVIQNSTPSKIRAGH